MVSEISATKCLLIGVALINRVDHDNLSKASVTY